MTTRPHCSKCGAFVSLRVAKAGTVLAAIDAALDAAEWIGPADAGTVEALRSVAAGLDAKGGDRLPGFEDSSNPAYDAQVMLRYLSALLMTPEARGVTMEDSEDGGDDLVTTLRAISRGG